LTGRGSAAQWHTQTRTAKSDVLRKLGPKDPHVEIHPADATALGVLRSGQWVLVESRRGLPMHDRSTNCLTDSVFDPESRQPAYKACAARVRTSWTGQRAPSSNGPDDVFGTTIRSSIG
jgi:assimilatory nitrate reductase catalytic subunit